MSCNYADGLSPYHDKGQLGLEEKFDSKSVVTAKVSLLTKWINEAKHIVIHTGAGISTSAGIPDFRSPKGVWTLQAKGEKPEASKDFNEAIPTVTHMAIMKLVEKGKVKYVVSQNIDGLHLRSNLPRKFLSELHGNMFTEQCSSCNRQFVRSTPVSTVGQKSLNKPCLTTKANGRPCRGKLHDTILDWEHNLPENDLGMADYHSCLADLSICLGTTMQIVPSGTLPLYTKKLGGKLVIVNLQPTKHDRKADLLIHAYVDEVMTMLMKNLNIKIPKYSPKNDPTRTLSSAPDNFLEWTISDYTVRKMKKIYEEKCGTKEARKRLEMIDDDTPLNITKTYKRKGKDDDDSDLEVLDVIVKPKKSRESSKRASKKNASPVYNTTITIKKVTAPAPKKTKFEGTEKITIKKNVTPTKTKYEIVTKPKKTPKCEIVYSTDGDLCNDLDMICESDDDEMTNNFTYNFRRYLHDDIKREDAKDSDKEPEALTEVKTEVKTEIKVEEEEKTKKEVKVEEENEEKPIEENAEEDRDADGSEENKNEEVVQIEDCDKDQESLPEEITIENHQETAEPESVFCEPNTSSEKSDEEAVNPLAEVTENPLPENINEEETQEGGDQKEGEAIPVEPAESLTTEQPEDSHPEENTAMEVDSEEAQPEKERTMQEELEDLMETTENDKTKEDSAKSKSPEKDKESEQTADDKEKTENLYRNIESELSSLSNPNLENQIDQIVSQGEGCQFESSLASCNITTGINDNYEFYNNEYSAGTNPLEYVDNNYYNNF